MSSVRQLFCIRYLATSIIFLISPLLYLLVVPGISFSGSSWLRKNILFPTHSGGSLPDVCYERMNEDKIWHKFNIVVDRDNWMHVWQLLKSLDPCWQQFFITEVVILCKYVIIKLLLLLLNILYQNTQQRSLKKVFIILTKFDFSLYICTIRSSCWSLIGKS